MMEDRSPIEDAEVAEVNEFDNGNDERAKKTLPETLAKSRPGATIELSTLRRQDGMIARFLDSTRTQNQGVVQTLITAIDDDNHYRQILKLARWKNPKQIDLFVKALNVCRITGARNALRHLLDTITAQSAGENAALMHEAVEAITHTTWTTREEVDKRKRNEQRNKTNSPLS